MNTISERIYDFLKGFPPFDSIQPNELRELSKQVVVVYLDEGETLFKEKDEAHDFFYVVKEGVIGLSREIEGEPVLVDLCDEGDVFGLRPLLQKDVYRMNAEVKEEVILYAVSVELFGAYISNQEAHRFLRARFSSNLQINPLENSQDWFAHVNNLEVSGGIINQLKQINYSSAPVSCSPQTPIHKAAETMARKKVGSILILENDCAKGIITDKDLRSKVATGVYPITETVDQIMSSPVHTFSPTISVTEAQMAMLKHQITHLCITDTGLLSGKVVGVLSEHDLLVQRGNNPSVILKEVKKARTVERLKEMRTKSEVLLENYIEQDVPMPFMCTVLGEINRGITQKAIELALLTMKDNPPCPFTWMALGSQGRDEQLLVTDQDNALVYSNVSKKEAPFVKSYFVELATKVNDILHQVGYEYCPAAMMAKNPKWCLSVDEWSRLFDNWIKSPSEDSIMLCTIFFDFSRFYGSKEPVKELTASVFKSISSYEVFLNYLARNALVNPPPVSFFRNIVLEQNGEHKDLFDIKARALMPLIDGARVLALSHQLVEVNNTAERFKQLKALEPSNAFVYDVCLDAFKVLLRFRTEQGLKHQDSGRYIAIKTLRKADRLKLKGAFKAIDSLQELIRTRFNLSQFM